jgi:hypothetical protein
MIRLWKLGNSEKGILPTKISVDKLLKFIAADEKGKVVDIIWDDMLKVEILTDDGRLITN